MNRQTIFACFVFSLSMPFTAAQGRLAKLPSSPTDVTGACSLVGVVLGRDVFAQTFLLKPEVGRVETIPFSRWTAFFKMSADSQNRRSSEIEPTAIRLGDRLCVVFDPNKASTTTILVVERAPSKLATSKTFGGRATPEL